MPYLDRIAAVAALCCFCSCDGHSAAAPPLRVLRMAPAGAEPVLLNQELTVYFSAPVDPLSVTPDSVSVVDSDGHQVPGRLDVGSHAVTFVPRPPLRPDLDDGSFRPAAEYRLLVAGYPRPGAVRGRDGRLLERPAQVSFRTVARDLQVLGLPSPLRPVADASLPFLLRQSDAWLPLPVDRPHLLLHFTLPVLPTSLSKEALTVSLQPVDPYSKPRHVEPRSLRLLDMASPTGFAGCTLEIDLGREVKEVGGGSSRLEPGDLIVVELNSGAQALLDYAGRPVVALAAQWWRVEPGATVTVHEWPEAEARTLPADPVLPGFEIRRDGTLRPQVRAEAGLGGLGVLRPTSDLELRPGVPFDRGDGVTVQSLTGDFDFLGIDIPAGVTVRVAPSTESCRLLAVGSIHIAGRLLIQRQGVEVPFRSSDKVTAAELLRWAPLCLLAGGDIVVSGEIAAAAGREAGRGTCALVAGGNIELVNNNVPLATVLAVENGRHIVGAVEASVPVECQLTSGLPAGGSLRITVYSAWTPMPWDQPLVRAELETSEPGAPLAVALQVVPADPVQPTLPDARQAQLSPLQDLHDGERVALRQGGFFRFVLGAEVAAGRPLPSLRRIRLRSD